MGPGAMRIPIAAAPLSPAGQADTSLEAEFSRVLAGDLDISGLFRVIDPASYIEGVPPGPLGPERVNFLNWQAVGARGVLLGRYERSQGELTVEVAFFDVPGHSMLGGRRFRGDPAEVARMAHRTADAILEFTTGIPGPFDSKLAFVSNRGGHVRELFTFTLDGKINKLTNHRSVVMAPAWSPDLRSIVFTSFRDGAPDLFSLDLASKAETKLASKMGLNIGGAWRPDGGLLAVAREQEGNTDLYTLDFRGQAQQRLTEHWGIDVDPSWSPDGSRLAFCSSRGGVPQVYTMSYPDKKVSRVTFSGNYNCSPVWSPDGRNIAYAGRIGRDFHVFVIPAGGGAARQLTFRGSNEDPTWSPDSRFIAFSREQGASKKIFLVDVTGKWERQLTTGDGDDTSPSWSRRLD
ncbi:MAG: Tol-Pal system beta propeller repeat protein TolB [Deltaproteobacteria bacterium]|nr:Tol-Pal system beta propeller repeat protein TolB [Deltaproteobacteria bacterium]